MLVFLKGGDWSKIERMNIWEKCVTFFEKRYDETWVFVSSYKHIKNAKYTVIPPNTVVLRNSTTIEASIPEGIGSTLDT